MKDFDKAMDSAGVRSLIFAHPQFEHLEAKGAGRQARGCLAQGFVVIAGIGQGRAQNHPKPPQSQDLCRTKDTQSFRSGFRECWMQPCRRGGCPIFPVHFAGLLLDCPHHALDPGRTPKLSGY